MERKTEAEILKEAAIKDLQDLNLPTSWADANVHAVTSQDKYSPYSFVLPAMQTYANQEKEAEAVAFAEWCAKSCTSIDNIHWNHNGVIYTTAYLYNGPYQEYLQTTNRR